MITSKQEKPGPPKDANKSQEEVAPTINGQTVTVEADVQRTMNLFPLVMELFLIFLSILSL